MERNLSKIDEGAVIRAEINVKLTMEKILRENDFEISDEEVQYYVEHHKIDPCQYDLVCSYWAKYFGSFRDTRLIGRRDYIKLMLILKKKMLMEAGHDENGSFAEYSKLPYLLSGNIESKINNRVIRNTRFIAKINDSYLYKNLLTKKYKSLNAIRPEYINELLSRFINTSFTYVVYERPDLLGKVIEYNEDKVSDESLFFINSI